MRWSLVIQIVIVIGWAWFVGWDLLVSQTSPLRRRHSRPRGEGHAAAYWWHFALQCAMALCLVGIVGAVASLGHGS